MLINEIKTLLSQEKTKDFFKKLYPLTNPKEEIDRYFSIIEGFENNFKENDIYLFSSPGRTEISGNHTDHNNGKVLGASINLDCIAAVSKTEGNIINIISESFNQNLSIDLNDLSASEKKAGTSDLLKGLFKAFKNNNYNVGAFNAYISSNVIASAGLSSSAAFETLICQILNTLYNNNQIGVVEYAHMSKYAENIYWDKQSGLLDQMCCAYGGLINIDFKDPQNPLIKPVKFDFSSTDYSLVIVQTGRGHADLSKDYSSIPNEMKAVAKYFNKEFLRQVDEKEFYNNITKIRKETTDRAILRAIHFFEENKRVDKIVTALEKYDFETAFSLIKESGDSSWKYLQNCYTNDNPAEQGISLSLALTEQFIKGNKFATCRVHGGGFAGVIMCILANELVTKYVNFIEQYQGKDSACIMSIREYGSICLNEFIK